MLLFPPELYSGIMSKFRIMYRFTQALRVKMMFSLDLHAYLQMLQIREAQ